MWARAGRLGEVADCAGAQRAWLALPAHKLYGIVGLSAWGDSVCAVVAALTIDACMSCGETIQGIVLGEIAAVAGGIIAARLVEPGVGILRHG